MRPGGGALLALGLLLGGRAWADPADALDPVARRLWDEGQRLETRGSHASAARRYEAVRRLDPAWTTATVALGRALAADGRDEEAERVWGTLPYDADAVEALVRHLLERGRPDEALPRLPTLRHLRPEWPGTLVLEARARAATEPVAAAGLLREYLTFPAAEPAADALGEATAEVVGGLRGTREAEALELAALLVEGVLAADPGSEPLLGPLIAEIAVDLVAAELERRVDAPLPPDQAARLRAAREAYVAGRIDEARRGLEVLVVEQPMSAVAWATLAEVRLAGDDPSGAEQALRAAERLDPSDADSAARLAGLLADRYGGRRDEEAAAAWARAARRRPEDPELWWQRGQAERRIGRWTQAAYCWRRVIELAPHGPRAAEAQRSLDGLSASAPPEVELPVTAGPPPEVSEVAWHAFHRAWAWRERTEPEAASRALAELAITRAEAPDFVPALALEAAVRTDLDQLGPAVDLLERALVLDPSRGDLAWRLASLEDRRGATDRARAWRDRAAALGDPDALLARAESEAEALRWWAARATLAEFFARSPGGPAWDHARELDRALVLRVRGAIAAAAAAAVAGFGLLLLPVGWWVRSRRGATLRELIERSPESWRAVATTCSTLRHEVIKHHLAVLDAVAAALDDGDPEPARWAADRWFGEEGALARLEANVAELEAVGRRAGAPLNPRRDPVLGPLLAGARRLRSLERSMRAGAGRGLADELRALGETLGRDAYRALGDIVDDLCLLPVDRELLLDVFARSRAEFAERDVPEPKIEAPAEPPHVRMFRADFVDALTNLVRNAIAANRPGGRVGLLVGLDEDPVTGLERVEVRVADEAPGRLTTAELRARSIDRGLGIAVDLVGRAGGSIVVRAEAGWAKAVVVELPRVERPAPGGEGP